MCPLTVAPEGIPLQVASLGGGGSFRKRLADLGIVPGATITLVRSGAPLLLALGESRFALGGGMARKILVLPQER